MCVCVSQDVKAGEVRNIKSMWENMGETFPQDEPHGKVHHAVYLISSHNTNQSNNCEIKSCYFIHKCVSKKGIL